MATEASCHRCRCRVCRHFQLIVMIDTLGLDDLFMCDPCLHHGPAIRVGITRNATSRGSNWTTYLRRAFDQGNQHLDEGRPAAALVVSTDRLHHVLAPSFPPRKEPDQRVHVRTRPGSSPSLRLLAGMTSRVVPHETSDVPRS